MKNLSILHASVVHSPYDDRIFFRQAQTLAKIYKKVYIIGFDDGLEIVQNSNKNIFIIKIIKQKIKKMNLVIYNYFIKINPDIIHIHDPYLMPTTYQYKLKHNVKIIYDIHENWTLLTLILSKQFFVKKYLHAIYLAIIEKYYLNQVSGIIVADDDLYKKYCKYDNIIQIRNYATTGRSKNNSKHQKIINKIIRFKSNNQLLIYIGHVDSSRNLDIPIKAVAQCVETFNLKMRFVIIGPGEKEYINHLKVLCNKYNNSTLLINPVLYNQIYDVLSIADYGWAAIPDNLNFKNRIPNKIFDYMRSGLIIIGSNLTFTKKLIEKNKIGKIDADDLPWNHLSEFYFGLNPVSVVSKDAFSTLIAAGTTVTE